MPIAAVILPEALERSLVDACRSRLPYEACGVIFGERDGDTLVAERFAVVRNAAASPERSFAFDPDDWIAVCFEAQKNQRRIVGAFHSHPVGPDRPSDRDEQALVPWESYWIVGFAGQTGGTGRTGKLSVYERTEKSWAKLPIKTVP